MKYAKIRQGHITLDGVRYFRCDALNMQIGLYGEKRGVGLNPDASRLEPKGGLFASQLDGHISSYGPFTIDQTSKKKYAIDGSLSMIVKGVKGKASTSVSVTRSNVDKLRVVSFVATENMELRQAFNSSPGPLQGLAYSRKPRRAVSRILVAFDASFAEDIEWGASIEVNAEPAIGSYPSMSFNIKPGGNKSTKVSIPDGSVVGYMLARPNWRRRKRDDRSVTFTMDQWG